MENKIIHFVFNEDDPQDKNTTFSKQILIKALPCWLVIDMPGFLACLNTLPDNYYITIWVHLQASQKSSIEYYAGEETASQLKTKFGDKLYFEYITRAHPTPLVHATNGIPIPVIHINNFSEKIQESKYHHLVSGLKDKLPTDNSTDDEMEDESILKKHISLEDPFIKNFLLNQNANKVINDDFIELKKFLSKIDFNSDLWFQSLFSKYEIEIDKDFGSDYWNYKSSVYKNHFGLEDDKIETDTISIENTGEDIQFIRERDGKEIKLWHAKLNFFYAVTGRFTSKTVDINSKEVSAINFEKVKQATRLYILHEALHQLHKLDFKTVKGIGNFPKTVEEADYQADAFAIITEFAYFCSGKSLSDTTQDELLQELREIIRTAIETTFSFNPLGKDLRAIQIRRVNRYLIWFYQLGIIEGKFSQKFADSTQALKYILTALSKKPIIEISGPSIYVNKSKDRIFYNLNDITHKEEIALFKDNEIIRVGTETAFDLKPLYEGLKKSNFDSVKTFIDKIFFSKAK